jgi:hypothetical protein
VVLQLLTGAAQENEKAGCDNLGVQNALTRAAQGCVRPLARLDTLNTNVVGIDVEPPSRVPRGCINGLLRVWTGVGTRTHAGLDCYCY